MDSDKVVPQTRSFIIFINDLSDNLTHTVKMYIDDTKIKGLIRKNLTDVDTQKTQEDIDKTIK